jgi:galactose mutarotase-like enzyme
MTYSLADGALEVTTTIANLTVEAIPVAIGYHSLFQIPDIPRDEWVSWRGVDRASGSGPMESEPTALM